MMEWGVHVGGHRFMLEEGKVHVRGGEVQVGGGAIRV